MLRVLDAARKSAIRAFMRYIDDTRATTRRGSTLRRFRRRPVQIAMIAGLPYTALPMRS